MNINEIFSYGKIESMDIRESIKKDLKDVLSEMGFAKEPEVTQPKDISKGDFTTNIAFLASKELKKSPQDIAEEIVVKLSHLEYLEKIEVVKGFINFWISNNFLSASLNKLLEQGYQPENTSLQGQKVMVEYAHPNTHKEMHIGHMRTLITGEAISRLLESQGSKVFRANYQGDIGPHVSKALYGIQKIMKYRGLALEEIKKWSHKDKAHLLGEGYVIGSSDYEGHKEEIDAINSSLYKKSEDLWPLYEETRRWSLDYYQDFYTRFYTRFDRLFFESEMAECGKKIVLENMPKVFTQDQGALIFSGEKYGLHTRVFVTKDGNPTYEGKEMCNALTQYQTFPFDKKIHVVASEQKGYFEVVFKALELIDPKKFKDKQIHLSMGMVQLSDRKISSRTGEVLTVDWLVDEVKEKVNEMLKEGRIKADDKEKVAEQITIGAIKYSVLKVGVGQNVAFDIQKSVSLDGDSGPYLQYTYARTRSVLAKTGAKPEKMEIGKSKLETEEENLLRLIYRYPQIVEEAALKYSPNVLASYLFDVAQSFNLFYQKHKILGSETENLRIFIALITARVLKLGLETLGIETPEQM